VDRAGVHGPSGPAGWNSFCLDQQARHILHAASVIEENLKMDRFMRTAGLVVAVAAATLAATLALACVQDSECDNGDTCSVPDTCVSGNCELGGGGDTNGDLVCDDELDPNIVFSITKLTVRRRDSLRDDNSAAKGSADLFLTGDAATAFDGTSDISIRFKDALSSIPPTGDGVDVSQTFPGVNCTSKGAGTLICRSATGKGGIKLKPDPIAPGQFKLTFKLKGLGDLTGPFFGPLQMVLSNGTRRASDQVTDCRLILSGIRCRVF
jgi:hypothetical protein